MEIVILLLIFTPLPTFQEKGKVRRPSEKASTVWVLTRMTTRNTATGKDSRTPVISFTCFMKCYYSDTSCLIVPLVYMGKEPICTSRHTGICYSRVPL